MKFFTSLFNVNYDDLWKAIIRPPRDLYSLQDLGPEKIKVNSEIFEREDFYIKNDRDLNLACSLWKPISQGNLKLPCIIYLHGNSSSRCESVNIIKYLLPLGVNVLAFDFAGCGHSEGEFISLGVWEKDDVKCVVEHLREKV